MEVAAQSVPRRSANRSRFATRVRLAAPQTGETPKVITLIFPYARGFERMRMLRQPGNRPAPIQIPVLPGQRALRIASSIG